MSLKLRLKPEEKVLVGGAVIRNGSKATEIIIENNVPILRQKDIMTEKEANSPARRVYFAIQLMYIDPENLADYHEKFWELAKDILAAAPSTGSHLRKISEKVLCGDYYQALKSTQKLMTYEEELLAHVKKSL